jgi:hypothetical protein
MQNDDWQPGNDCPEVVFLKLCSVESMNTAGFPNVPAVALYVKD